MDFPDVPNGKASLRKSVCKEMLITNSDVPLADPNTAHMNTRWQGGQISHNGIPPTTNFLCAIMIVNYKTFDTRNPV